MMKALKSDKNFLVIDLGNSTLSSSIFQNDKIVFFKKYISNNVRCYGDFKELLSVLVHDLCEKDISVDEIIFSSVVSNKTSECIKGLKHFFNADIHLITNEIKTPYIMSNSSEIGSDIYANLVEGRIKSHTKPCIIVDFGTALTVSCTDDSGKVIGVVIYPGTRSCIESLFNNAPILRKLYNRQTEDDSQNHVINEQIKADNTKKAIDVGMCYGTAGAVISIINFFKKQLNNECYLIATGGDSNTFAPFIKEFDEIDELHTLKGIYHIYQKAI